MTSLFANVNLFLFICIIVHIATDVAAQQSPVSLLPKAQRTFQLDKKLPQQGSEIKSSTKSSNSEGVVVQTNRLEALNLETTGILNIETGGFDKNMWNGTAHSEAVSLLKKICLLKYILEVYKIFKSGFYLREPALLFMKKMKTRISF